MCYVNMLPCLYEIVRIAMFLVAMWFILRYIHVQVTP